MFAVSSVFKGERYNRVLRDDYTDDTTSDDDPAAYIRLLEPDEKRPRDVVL